VIWRLVRFFLFRTDAESAHRATVAMIRLMLRISPFTLRLVSRAPRPELRGPADSPTVFGMCFLSPVGLAAGFDKDAEIIEALPALGFGFAEIGTVTPRPQPGNDRPRLFRDPARRTVFNRMGFNSLGATLVSERLRAAKPRLPEGFRVGVNIGKNKDTPLEKAADDFADAIRPFAGLADYVVINVSSPNTPGLRSLQTVEGLRPIVMAVDVVLKGWSQRPPLLLKFAPEIDVVLLQDLMQAAEPWGIDGWVLTNTLAGEYRPGVTGGWSGAPLTELARERVTVARSLTRKPIISVGGVVDAEEARMRRRSGADLVQIYSGWIFGGPTFPARVAKSWTTP